MKKKRYFSRMELEVAPEYVYPASRRRWLNLGLILACLALLWAAADFFLLDAEFVSSGPLSSDHVRIGSDCAACHSPPNATPAKKCAACHESGEWPDDPEPQLALYGYQAHYAYFSDDLTRREESGQEHSCSHCHMEHLGRRAYLIQVPDARCTSCHQFTSFSSGHPGFLPAPGGVAQVNEQGGLKFPHAVHVNKVLPEERNLREEAACLYCHHPEETGRGFQALSFELHCGDGCHLNKASPLLELASGGLGRSPGVLQVGDLEEADPAAPCLPSINPRVFRGVPPQAPRRIRLQSVRHQDCWIEENFRILRRTALPDLGLADLLLQHPPQEFEGAAMRERYLDAVEALAQRLVRVRHLERTSEGAFKLGELDRGGQADKRLQQARERLRSPGAVTPGSMLADPSHAPDNPLDQLLLQTWTDLRRGGYLPEPAFAGGAGKAEELARRLTLQCRECHSVSLPGFAPVSADQETFRRALFDHSAHLVQMQCADCHPSVTAAEEDRGEMLHLPSIDTCRGCHSPGMTSQDCVTCHLFHPHKDRRLPLLSRRAKENADD